MAVPRFLLRKLYKRGSLRETADGRFSFTIHNPLATATLTSPPEVVVNGVFYEPSEVQAGDIDLTGVSPDAPLVFGKGTQIELSLPGRLLRGGNRIHIAVDSKEFGRIDFLVEDKEADFCDITPKGSSEEE